MVNRAIGELNERELERPAIVFSPHFDDETLGCGGTVIKKKRLGAEVKIVFMTDGSQSHRQFISPDALRVTRAGEGLAAAHVLGLDSPDVMFLGHEERNLHEHEESAVAQVHRVLDECRPAEVFVPYRYDALPDHLQTRQIVLSAMAKHGERMTVNEYPIWFWLSWPWASNRVRGHGRVLRAPASGMLSIVHLLRDFRHGVYVEDVLPVKHLALRQHRSQTERLAGDPQWPILADVSDGEFLDCFFQERELFYRYVL